MSKAEKYFVERRAYKARRNKVRMRYHTTVMSCITRKYLADINYSYNKIKNKKNKNNTDFSC